jgi:hypothetical protein
LGKNCSEKRGHSKNPKGMTYARRLKKKKIIIIIIITKANRFQEGGLMQVWLSDIIAFQASDTM